MIDHICGVDCEPQINPINGSTIHVMYPTENINWTKTPRSVGKFNMTRREFRESGQDETRNARLWNYQYNNGMLEPLDIRKLYRIQNHV